MVCLFLCDDGVPARPFKSVCVDALCRRRCGARSHCLGRAAHLSEAIRNLLRCVPAVIFLSVPIYRQRNERWVLPADLSTHVVRTLRVATAGYSGGQVVVVDDAAARFGLDSSFGTSFGNAVHLMVGTNWEGVIVPATNRAVTNPPGGATRLDFALRNGQLAPAAQ